MALCIPEKIVHNTLMTIKLTLVWSLYHSAIYIYFTIYIYIIIHNSFPHILRYIHLLHVQVSE